MKTIITVDVEAHRGRNPIDFFIWGKDLYGNEYGLKYIIKTFNQYGYKALFFVDIAEAFDYEEERIKEVLDYIIESGHDIGVHIHPEHVMDKKRPFLFDYSYEEQFEIIRRCTDLFIKMTNRQPEAFRAGRYSANHDTLKCIAQLGYRYDFSQFYGNKWCGIVPPVCYTHPIKLKNGLIEFPVMIFRSISIFNFYKRFDKIDLTMNHGEFKSALQRVQKDDNIIVPLFFHSFSLLKNRQKPEKLFFDEKTYKRLCHNLEFCRKKEYMAIGLDNLKEINITTNMDCETDIPASGSFLHQMFYSLIRLKDISDFNKKASKILFLIYGALIIFTALMTYLIICYFK